MEKKTNNIYNKDIKFIFNAKNLPESENLTVEQSGLTQNANIFIYLINITVIFRKDISMRDYEDNNLVEIQCNYYEESTKELIKKRRKKTNNIYNKDIVFVFGAKKIPESENLTVQEIGLTHNANIFFARTK